MGLGPLPGTLNYTNGLAFSHDGDLLLVDYNESAILRVKNGQLEKIAGQL